MFKNVNKDFSLTRFLTFVVFGLVLPFLVFMGARTKAFGNWLANANWTWLVLILIIVAAIGAVGWMVETKKRGWTYAAIVLAIAGAILVALNLKVFAAAFTGTAWLASLAILVGIVVVVVIGLWIARRPADKHSGHPSA